MGFKSISYVAAIVVGIGTYAGVSYIMPEPSADPMPVAAAVPMAEVVPLLQHTTQSIDISAPRISTGRRKLLAGMLTQIAQEVFTERGHQEYWIALIGVESRYESSSKSSAGAVGLGQLIPKFATGFGTTCGLTEITASDVTDDYTNAFLSACQFRALIEQFGGNIPLALCGYNAGANSSSIKRLQSGASPVEETSGYISKVWTSKEKTSATTPSTTK